MAIQFFLLWIASTLRASDELKGFGMSLYWQTKRSERLPSFERSLMHIFGVFDATGVILVAWGEIDAGL